MAKPLRVRDLSHVNDITIRQTLSTGAQATVEGNLVPDAADLRDLGSSANPWNRLFVNTVIPGGGGGPKSFHITGRWETPHDAGFRTGTVVNNILFARPFYVENTRSYTGIGTFNTAAGTGGVLRMGIWNDNGSIYPGSLLIDAGERTVSGTGIQSLSITQTLNEGVLYWIGGNEDHTSSPTFQLHDTSSAASPTLFGRDNSFVGFYAWIHNPFTYGALPDPFPAGAAELTSDYMIHFLQAG